MNREGRLHLKLKTLYIKKVEPLFQPMVLVWPKKKYK